MKPHLLAALACIAVPAALRAQMADPFGERQLAVPAVPGQVAPWRGAAPAAPDPAETGSLLVAPTGPTLADWYAAQGRPSVVLFFERRLERMPPGWNGTSRLRISYEGRDRRNAVNEQLIVGVEHKAPTASVRNRLPLAVLMEGALLRELQSSRLKLVDPTVAERTLAARGRGGDTEFDALHGSAGYILEVELVPVADSVSLVGSLKGLRTSEIVATIREPVEQDLRNPAEVDALARRFVRRLLASPAAAR
jgi:hypothetical protein